MQTITLTEQLDNNTLTISAKRITRTNITAIVKKNMKQIALFCGFGRMIIDVTDDNSGDRIASGTLDYNAFTGQTNLNVYFK